MKSPSPSRSKLTTDEVLVLSAWDDLPEEWGLGYHGVIHHTQKTKSDLKPIIASLKQKGYLKFWRGGIDEEGLACGSCWGITRLGQEAYYAYLQTKSSPSNNLKGQTEDIEHIIDELIEYEFHNPNHQPRTMVELREKALIQLQNLLANERNLILDTILASPEMQDLPEIYTADMSYKLKQERLANRERNEEKVQIKAMLEGMR